MNALENMVENQIRSCNISDETTLNTMRRIPRAQFVPEEFHSLAYSESLIPLGHQEVMLTPFMEASILQSLCIKKNETALIIGTGSGYLTALVAHQAQHVFSVDTQSDFIATAHEKLKSLHIYNASLEHMDGSLGFEKNAPYDLIVVTGGIPFCPDALKKQLALKGRLFAFIGETPDYLTATLITKLQSNVFETQNLFETGLPMLHHRYPSEPFQF